MESSRCLTLPLHPQENSLKTPLILSICALAVASAQSPAPSAKPVRTLKYLTREQLDPSRLLPPPPVDGSTEQQREMAEVKRNIRTRTAERLTQARWDAEHEDAGAFSAVLGPAFDLAKLPATAKLLSGVVNDQAIAASMAKDFFRRKFPVTAEMPANYGEWTCDAGDRKPASRPLRSYPSGHSTLAYSVGLVLANLVPGKAQAVLSRSAEYAYSREVCGDHYHSDVDASRVLGTAVGILFLESPSVKADLDAARAELRSAGLN